MINLLPEAIKEDMIYGRKNRQILNWLVTAMFGVVILFMIAAVGRLTIQTARDQTLVQKQNMEEQLKVANFDTISDQYGDYVDGLESVEKLYGQQVLYTRLIRKLGTLLPSGARLTNVSLSDKDRAIGLNFDNDVDGLGPLIQTNLTDQGKQVSDKTRTVFADNLRVPLTGATQEGSSLPNITTDSTKQSISFYVHSPNQSFDERLTIASRSGGDMAFMVVYDNLDENKNLEDYKVLSSENKMKNLKLVTQPQIRSYDVRANLKAVDFVVSANSVEEAKQLEQTLLGSKNSIFIEAYTFENKEHANKNRCKDEMSDETVCEAICTKSTCSNNNKSCSAIVENGCRYTVRAYYDELYETATLKKLSNEEMKKCSSELTGLGCTHQITASYNQLFSKVDLNRVSACTVDVTTGTSNCPVEMRAEFSDDAKFYLISSGGSL